jgi:transcriptional regulator with XRE-family HTH domain
MTVESATSKAERDWLLDVGMRVRLARVRAKETQEELAARAGVSRVTVGSIERADHPAVVLAYRRLAQALGLSLAELLDGAL